MAYASEYYDPVKAHEYYMKHRQLKGKNRTGTLNETGQNAKSYIKSKVVEDKNKALDDTLIAYSKKVERENISYKDRLSAATSEISAKLSKLQKKFQKLTPAQKKILGPKLKSEIFKIKNIMALTRERLETARLNAINSIKAQSASDKQKIKDKYSNIYESEVDKLYNNSSMLKAKKSKESKTESTETSKKSKESKTESTETSKYIIPKKLLQLREQYAKEDAAKGKKKTTTENATGTPSRIEKLKEQYKKEKKSK